MQSNIGTKCNCASDGNCAVPVCSVQTVHTPDGNLLLNAWELCPEAERCMWLYSASREYSSECCYIFPLLGWGHTGERLSFVAWPGRWLPGCWYRRRLKDALSLLRVTGDFKSSSDPWDCQEKNPNPLTINYEFEGYRAYLLLEVTGCLKSFRAQLQKVA